MATQLSGDEAMATQLSGDEAMATQLSGDEAMATQLSGDEAMATQRCLASMLVIASLPYMLAIIVHGRLFTSVTLNDIMQFQLNQRLHDDEALPVIPHNQKRLMLVKSWTLLGCLVIGSCLYSHLIHLLSESILWCPWQQNVSCKLYSCCTLVCC